MTVPVVPGDGRVACQHCTARICLSVSPANAWIDLDATDSDKILWCEPATDVRAAILWV